MKKLAAALAVSAVLVSGLQPAGAGPTAGGFASDNVEFVKEVPFDVGTATGAKVVGKYLYVTSWRAFSIYDVSDPIDPQLLSTTPFGFKFENEDVSTNGSILVFSETLPQSNLHIWDVEDKTNPTSLATLAGAGQHTMSCILKCKYLYGSGGSIVDLRDPSDPKVAGNWGEGMPANSSHDVNEVAPGLVLTSSRPVMLLDARKDPLHPKLLAAGEDERIPGTVHSNTWPRAAKDRFFLVSSETNFQGRCAGDDGAFMTWDASTYRRTGSFRMVDVWKLDNGTYQDGNPAVQASGCSAHWFEHHPDFHNGGIVAVGSYDHGTRFLEVSPKGKIGQAGYFLPYGGTTMAAYWLNDEIVYGIDLSRGIDILRWTAG
ncbi:MAG: hypothetical protein M3323_01690 [Actinomycetota bacterium]|nr:hypothetical protein [Actinomycetota bacterium]